MRASKRTFAFLSLLIPAWLASCFYPGSTSESQDAGFVTAPLPEWAGGGDLAAWDVGHQLRQDDWPAAASSPDGSVWIAWLSFDGQRDDIAIRHYKEGQWGPLQWVPGTSGDSWLPQLVVDASRRVWVLWSQQVKGNWDIFARRFDPGSQKWGRLERFTDHPLPDINPRGWSNAAGQGALVWQGFRGKNSNIFLKTFDGETWLSTVRVTHREANDWEPDVALDSQGTVWVVYDSYKNGNYDVFLSGIRNGQVDEEEIVVAQTPRFEARPTVTVDNEDRVWVAWEEGLRNWGKDTGLVIFDRQPGVELGGHRRPRLLCYENNRWQAPANGLNSVFPEPDTYQPHVFSDSQGFVWVIAKKRTTLPRTKDSEPKYYPPLHSVYWEYFVTRYDGEQWSRPFALPRSKGRSSTRVDAAPLQDGGLWLTWPTDNRVEKYYTRALRQQVYAAEMRGFGSPEPFSFQEPGRQPVESKPVHADEPGDVLAARSYEVTLSGRPHRILRGDLHRHTDLSWDRGGEPDGNLWDFYRYMFDAAAMDFGASTDHSNGQWPYWTWYSQKMSDLYHVPGTFLPIFGYERSAAYPNGHRNIFFAKRSEYRMVPFFLKDGSTRLGLPRGGQGDEPTGTGDLASNDTKLLYEEIRPRRGIAISHTSGAGGGTDWRDNDPDLEPVVEIFQGCRTSYEQLGAPFVAGLPEYEAVIKRNNHYPQGMVSEAWKKGYKLGVIASSDHFSTHLSYAMVYTSDPTREGILDAIRKRHTYGAMDNIVLDVRMGSHFMGDVFSLRSAEPLQVYVRGTRPIASIDVIKDSEVIYSSEPGRQEVRLEFTDQGDVRGKHYYYVRVRQDDGMLAWSSPMFVNYE